LNNDEDDVATLDFLRRILSFVDQTKGQTEGTTLKKRKTKKRTQRKGTNKINQKSSTIFTSTN